MFYPAHRDALREMVEQQYLAQARALIRTCDEQRKGERYGDAFMAVLDEY